MTGVSSPPRRSAAAFGTVTAPYMVASRTSAGRFSAPSVEPFAPVSLHPAAHALHYGSTCFEGLKAHRGTHGVVRLFRAADHARRFCESAEALCLPVPPEGLVAKAIRETVAANIADVPAAPGSLYVRPTLIGVDAHIGAATTPSSEAMLFVIASPVGEYFRGEEAVTVAVETRVPRSTPGFGRVKAGGNYAMALGPTQRARTEHGASQVLFAPGGDVQEAGAANFLLVDDDRVVTRPLDGAILHGVTRDSVLAIARALGYTVEERFIDVGELREWARRAEAALVGTAAVMTGVGALVHEGERIPFGSGKVGANTKKLRAELIAVQRGEHADRWGWTEAVPAPAA